MTVWVTMGYIGFKFVNFEDFFDRPRYVLITGSGAMKQNG